MTYESEADRHAADAARAIHEGNVTNAKALLEVATQNLADAEKALKAHTAKESK